MRKQTNTLSAFQKNALSPEGKKMIKGGKKHKKKDPVKEIEKVQKKLEKAMKKNKTKDILKYRDQLDCLGVTYSIDTCCGNGIGIW